MQKVGPALDLFDARTPEWGVTEVATALGMPKSSAHALLQTMETVGLLERTPRARYRLGWRLLSLSSTLIQTTGYRTGVVEAMHRAVDQWGEPMHLGVFDRGCVVYVECARARRSPALPTSSGMRLAAHPSAVGKVLLAHRGAADIDRYLAKPLERLTNNTIVDSGRLRAELDAVRARGYAVDREEAIAGISCVAAPVHDSDGLVVAAVSLAAPTRRLHRDTAAYLQLVREVARAGVRSAPAAA